MSARSFNSHRHCRTSDRRKTTKLLLKSDPLRRILHSYLTMCERQLCRVLQILLSSQTIHDYSTNMQLRGQCLPYNTHTDNEFLKGRIKSCCTDDTDDIVRHRDCNTALRVSRLCPLMPLVPICCFKYGTGMRIYTTCAHTIWIVRLASCQ